MPVRKQYILFSLLFVSCGIFIGSFKFGYCTARLSPFDKPTESTPLNDLLKKNKIDPGELHIEVSKKQYLLYVMAGTKIIKSYPVVLGSNPRDDKRMEGDGCTPEGTFRIQSKYPHEKWSKFMWINYPTADSYYKHKQAKKEGKIPANARIGGQVGIHGVKKGQELLNKMGVNWTKGCISLSNQNVNELYNVILTNTKVIIRQ